MPSAIRAIAPKLGRYARAMSRQPIWRRLLDVLALLACALGAAGMLVGAVDADGWPSRLVLASVGVGLLVTALRGTRIVATEWR